MQKFKKVIETNSTRIALLLLLSLLFFVSAATKFLNVPLFETSVYASGIPLKYAELVSRLVLIAEVALGIFLLIVINKKDFLILVLTFLFFTVFDISLIIDIVKTGGKDNCGCFGDVFIMDSKTALIKNLIIQVIIFPFLIFKLEKPTRHLFIHMGLITVISAITLLSFPISPIFSEMKDRIKHTNINDTPIATEESELVKQLTDKSQFLIFVHHSCSHCKKLTKKLNRMRNSKLLPPTKIVIYGKPKKIETFMNETENELPFVVVQKNTHLLTSNGVFPSIFFYHNDSLHGKWPESHFDPKKTYNTFRL